MSPAASSRVRSPMKATAAGLPQPAAARRTRLGRLGAGRLGDHRDDLDLRVGGQGLEGGQGRGAAYLVVEVAAARPQGVAHPHPGVVEQAAQLLDAGAGGAHDAHRPGAHRVGEAEAHPVDDGRARPRAHDQEAAPGRLLLEGHLLGEGHVVAEDHHRHPGLQGVHGLDEGVRAGDRDEGQVRPRHRGHPASAAGAANRPPDAAGGRRQGGLGGRHGRRRRPSSAAARTATTRSSGPIPSGGGEAQAGQQGAVEVGGHGHQGPLHSRAPPRRRHWPA